MKSPAIGFFSSAAARQKTSPRSVEDGRIVCAGRPIAAQRIDKIRTAIKDQVIFDIFVYADQDCARQNS